MSEFKYVIKGSYADNNFGDDVLLVANLRVALSLVEPEDILILGQYPEFVAKQLKIQLLDKNENQVGINARLLVYGGGTQFYSFCNESAGFTRLRRLAALLKHPQRIYSGLKRRVLPQVSSVNSVAALGVGFGPFVPTSRAEQMFYDEIERLEWIGVRDTESLKLCSRHAKGEIVAGADICFSTELWTHFDFDGQFARKLSGVVFIPRDWHHSNAGAMYIEPMFAVAAKIAEKGERVTVVLFSEKDKFCASLALKYGLSVDVWNSDRFGIDEFLGRLADYSVVVTARFHGAVFSSLLKIPTVFIEIEPKLKFANIAFGDETKLWSHPFCPSELLRLVELSQGEIQTEKVACKIQDQSERANLMVKKFKNFAATKLGNFR